MIDGISEPVSITLLKPWSMINNVGNLLDGMNGAFVNWITINIEAWFDFYKHGFFLSAIKYESRRQNECQSCSIVYLMSSELMQSSLHWSL